jgi:two-component system NarL family sensor kinase
MNFKPLYPPLFLLVATISPTRAIPTDTLLTQFYARAANLMEIGRYDNAQATFDSAFAVKGVKQSPVYPVLLNEQATLLIYLGKTEEAFEMKKSVLPYLPQMADLEKHISVYNDLAILYRQRHINDSTLYYYNKALEVALQYKDESWIAHIYNNLSIFYFNIRQLDEAEKYTDLAAKHCVNTDDAFVTFSSWQLRAGIKSELNKLEEAESSIRKAWNIACKSGENATAWKMRCMPSLLRVFERKEQPDSVEYYLQIGNKLLEEMPVSSIPAIGFIQVRAVTEKNRGNYRQALKDYLWLRKKDTGSEPKTLLTQIAQCYHATGNDRLAYTYMDSARMWTDSLAQQNLTRQMAELNVKFQTQEKELQIARLQQEKLTNQAIFLKTVTGAGCLLVLTVLGIVILYYKKRSTEKEIQLLRQEKELDSTRRYIEGLEEECKFFAKELHDGIANDLLGIQMKMSLSNGQTSQEVTDMIKKVHHDVRSISHELMPPEFEQLSLNEILQHYAQTQAQNSQLDIRFQAITAADATAERFSSRTSREIYRIVQEVTTNILKHSVEITRIDITLTYQTNRKCELKITDNGKQTKSIDDHQPTKGIGLRTVTERAKSIGGIIEFSSMEGNNQFILSFNNKQDESRKL